MNHEDEHENYHKPATGRRWWLTRNGIATALLIIVVAVYLLAEHLMHIYQVLPWLFLGACLVMHLFMHHGHGGHGKDGNGRE